MSAISFEFFPPKTPEGVKKLGDTLHDLAALRPEFISVTFGAGGSTREGTLSTVLDVIAQGVAGAPHLSCVGSTRENTAAILDEYRAHGIRRIVALRGDLPSGWGPGSGVGEFRYANELVSFIREHCGDWFHIEVAAYPEFHPQARSAEADIENFVRKVRAGADSAITQYFFNADAYFRFVDEVRAYGVDVPIVPGIMPITNYSQLARFSESCGAEIPRWIRLKLQSFGDDREAIRAFGLDVIADLCDRLLKGGAPGLHFYTLNQAPATVAVCERLALTRGLTK